MAHNARLAPVPLVLAAALLWVTLQACLGIAAFVGIVPSSKQPSPRSLVLRHGANPFAVDSGSPFAAPADLGGPPLFGAQRSPSGLAWQVLQSGSGPRPTDEDTLAVRYTAWSTKTGQMISSSLITGDDGLGQVSMSMAMPGLKEALLTMQPGEKRRLWIPGQLANGKEEDASEELKKWGPPLGQLVYDIEFIGVKKFELGGIPTFFAGLGAFLLAITALYSVLTATPSRPEQSQVKASITFEIPKD